jgi:hypothetical protein
MRYSTFKKGGLSSLFCPNKERKQWLRFWNLANSSAKAA